MIKFCTIEINLVPEHSQVTNSRHKIGSEFGLFDLNKFRGIKKIVPNLNLSELTYTVCYTSIAVYCFSIAKLVISK